MTLSHEFVQAVREGRVEGLEIKKQFFDNSEYLVCNDNGVLTLGEPIDDEPSWAIDHLCAHLRRWMESKVWTVTLGPGKTLTVTELIKSRVRPRQDGFIMMTPSSETFTQDTELARHVEAALWVLGREG
jgi:hypothetical protein